ncbi:hypothetical protein N7540_013137 [Penicillium herquei]|nr:hypothetical protein N7540_013137 [Penicillium herquei]
MPLALGLLILVVSSIDARKVLFPPAPRSLVNIRTGGIQKPQAGVLGTNDTLTGAPEKQIAITLLRIGEAHKTPLPPVPTSKPDDPDYQTPFDAENILVGATRSDFLNTTIPSVPEKAHGDANEEEPKHRHVSKFVRFLKGNAKFFVGAKLAIDHVRAATGSQKAKGHLGVLPKTKSIIYSGPSEYQCRFEGKIGWAVITESAKASVLFTRDDPRLKGFSKLESVFEIALNDIKRMKRATAFVNSAIEEVVAFSSDQKLLASLEIEDKEGKTWRLTVMPERDELFNRLVAAGDQRWENL